MVGTTSTLAQTRVKNPTPNTQRMVSTTLAKHRAKQEHKRPMVTISNETLAKIFGFCGVPIPSNSIKYAVANTCSAATQKAMKDAVVSSKDEFTTLNLLNMIVPGAFSEKEKEQWKALPKETRQAIIGIVVNPGQSNWDGLNEAQKAVIHGASNGQ